jgi:hypothetical protein
MTKNKALDPSHFLYAIFIFIAFSQLLTTFRIAVIFNSEYLALPMQLGLMICYIWLFLARSKKLKMTKIELILLLYPIIMIPWGLYNNKLDRHTFSEPVLIALFILTVVVFRSAKVQNKTWRFGANIMTLSLSLFLVLLFALNNLGVTIFSVAKTSIYFVFPALYYLFFNQTKKLFFTLILIILSTKRSLLIALPISIIVYFFDNPKFRDRTKVYLGVLLVFFFIFLLLFFSDSKLANYFPGHLNALYYKMALINPLSDIYDAAGDYRFLEVTHSFNQSMQGVENYFFGMGPGFTYDVYKADGTLWFEDVYNTHFTYISILSKYGFGYLILLLIYLFNILKEGFLAIRQNSNPIISVLLCFYLCSLVETLTSYSLFINILNAAVMGQISFYARDNFTNKMA